MQKTLKTRLLLLLLIFLMCVGCMIPANAYELVYIQTSIDTVQWEIVSSVLRSDVGVTRHSPEFRRIPDDTLAVLATGGNSVGEFNDGNGTESFKGIIELRDHLEGDLSIANNMAQAGVLNNVGIGLEDNRIMSFPTKQDNRNDSTPEQYKEALKVNNTLILGLNQAFNAYITKKGYPKKDDAGEYLDKMVEFLGQCSVSGDNYTFEDNGKPITVKWRMQKSDGQCISWGAIVYEAFFNYCLEGDEAVTSNNIYDDKLSNNIIVTAVTWLFGSLLNGIRSMLGLWSMDELIFNQDLRGVSYIGGVFPATWEQAIWTLFSVFEIFGAAMLMAGIIVSVVHKLLSTTNFVERMHLMSRIQDLIICAIILALLPFALRVLLSFSESITQMCYSIVPGSDTDNPKEIATLVRRFTASNGTLAGIVGQFVYLGLEIYFNFYYAIRSFSVPVLIVMSPFFVCGICLSSGKKQQAIQWSKELISFIFMQPIHAFLIAFLLYLQPSHHAFDNIVALYALIPLSQTIKSFVFGQTSGFAERASERAKNVTTGLTAAAGMGALAAGAKGVGGLISAAKSGGGGSSDSSGTDPSGGGDPGSSDPSGPTPPMGDASKGGIFKSAVGKVKSGVAKVGHTVANSKVGQGVQKAANSKVGRAAKAVGRGAKKLAVNPVTKIGAGMLLGAAGGAIGSVGGRDLGRMTSDLGSSVIAGRNINKKNDTQNQDPGSSNPEPENNNLEPENFEPDNDAMKNITPPDLNVGGTRDADDVVNGRVMQIRNYNQNDLNKMGISDASYDRGSLRFSSSGDSPQAQDLRAYAQYLKSLPPEQRLEEMDKRGISATQDGDITRVRVNGKAWSNANDGAKINAYTNKKGESSIQVSTPEGSAPPSFTGGYVMSVNPSDIKGYQAITRIGKGEDGIVKKEKFGQIPLNNMTATQRSIIASGKGVTQDENHMYVPLNKDGNPENYTQKVSFSARSRHVQETQQMEELKEKTAETPPEQEQPAPTEPPTNQTNPASDEQTDFESSGIPVGQSQFGSQRSSAGSTTQEIETIDITPTISVERPRSEQPPAGQHQSELPEIVIDLPQSPSTGSIDGSAQAPSPTQPEPAEPLGGQTQSEPVEIEDAYAYYEDLNQELDEIDLSDFLNDFAD